MSLYVLFFYQYLACGYEVFYCLIKTMTVSAFIIIIIIIIIIVIVDVVVIDLITLLSIYHLHLSQILGGTRLTQANEIHPIL